MEHLMPSRRILISLALAAFLAAPIATIARASETPADSSMAAPADSSSSEAKQDLKDAKDDAKDAIKDEVKKADDAKDEAKDQAKKDEKAAKKTAKKNKTKAAAAAKGSVKSVESAAAKPGTMPEKPSTPPQHVQVQHILIGFSGSVPGKAITRSKEEAKTLAYQILDRARKGEDFDELVKQYTDDSPPGIYGMSEKGLQPGPGEYPRDGMVAAFGNVGFNISPGNIGIADYDPQASPFGYHIIKRLK
jgi:hypothetical protein